MRVTVRVRGGTRKRKLDRGAAATRLTQLALEVGHVIVVQVRQDHGLGVDNDHRDDGSAVNAP